MKRRRGGLRYGLNRRKAAALVTIGLASCGSRGSSQPEEPRKVHVARPAAPVVEAGPPPANAGEDKFAEAPWNVLRGLNVQTGEASPLVELLSGANVKIAGYMVPFDDGFEEVNEFLLVPTAGACIHTPPPPANQIVYAQMSGGRTAKVEMMYSIWACGRLDIASTESVYGPTGFRMNVAEIRRRG